MEQSITIILTDFIGENIKVFNFSSRDFVTEEILHETIEALKEKYPYSYLSWFGYSFTFKYETSGFSYFLNKNPDNCSVDFLVGFVLGRVFRGVGTKNARNGVFEPP